jgi:hypothetical protein
MENFSLNDYKLEYDKIAQELKVTELSNDTVVKIYYLGFEEEIIKIWKVENTIFIDSLVEKPTDRLHKREYDMTDMKMKFNAREGGVLTIDLRDPLKPMELHDVYEIVSPCFMVIQTLNSGKLEVASPCSPDAECRTPDTNCWRQEYVAR